MENVKFGRLEIVQFRLSKKIEIAVKVEGKQQSRSNQVKRK